MVHLLASVSFELPTFDYNAWRNVILDQFLRLLRRQNCGELRNLSLRSHVTASSARSPQGDATFHRCTVQRRHCIPCFRFTISYQQLTDRLTDSYPRVVCS